jgi:sec-independent protein translocase protein TatC
VLTPPDVFSQTLLAVPMYVLYEIALLVCARFLPDR